MDKVKNHYKELNKYIFVGSSLFFLLYLTPIYAITITPGPNEFESTIQTIGSEETTVVITGEHSVLNNPLDIPDNVILEFKVGGSLNIDSGATLTIESPYTIKAIQTQFIFKGDGSVSFNKPGVVSPDWWGAAPNNTDSTAAINKAINAVVERSRIQFSYGDDSSYYLIQTIPINKSLFVSGPTMIHVKNVAGAGFILSEPSPSAPIEGIRFQNIAIICNGPGLIANYGIVTDGAAVSQNMRIENLNISGCRQNLDLKLSENAVVKNTISTGAKGVDGGWGYGLVAGYSSGLRVISSTFKDNGRHAIYSRGGKDIVITGNTFENHANTSQGGLYAINIAGVQNSSIIGNVFRNTKSSNDISIDYDDTGSNNASGITISDNSFYSTTGNDGGIDIGVSSPASGRKVENILILGNVFHLSPSSTDGAIMLTNGENVSIQSNQIFQPSGSVDNFVGVFLNTPTGDTYYKNISIVNNSGQLGTSGGSSYLVLVGSGISAGTTKLTIKGNNIELNNSDDLIYYSGQYLTNPNIYTDWTKEKVVIIDNGDVDASLKADFNVAGYNRFVVSGNLSAGSAVINKLVNGYYGKEIHLRFTDQNITVNRNNAYLSGGVNFYSSANDYIVLRKGTNGVSHWREITRSVNQ